MELICAVESGEAHGEFDRISCLAGNEAYEVVQEDDVLETDGESLQEELQDMNGSASSLCSRENEFFQDGRGGELWI